jgi:pimeloyl-ACP methyl ester carboxylesterase
MIPVHSFYKAIDDTELYVEIFASGELENSFGSVFKDDAFLDSTDNVFILLHGNGEDGRLFSENIESFCNDSFVITVDSRGHGKSKRGTEPLTIDLMAEDLAKLCDEMNIGNFSLLGFSDGGNIALTYAVRHPERLSKLVLVGANINPGGIKTKFMLFTYFEYYFTKLFCFDADSKKQKLELLVLMLKYPNISPRLLKNIICPALVLDAQNDVIKRKHTKLIADSINSSKHIRISNSGHNIFKDNADEANRIISDFINKGAI